ncbi:c-type cytochrome biogenesis protein CcmI [Zhongshania borealis]|uniref:C-type cytochrome biogenesis protein CcmI n=1 Tax=Zhongshania borealis TaxID=889488 RepID=A0ABP7W921_9GAMM
MMTLYLGIAILLGLAVVFVLLGARSSASTSADGELHRRAQRRFYLQRRSELTADRDAGLIDETQYQDLERELDRQLVSESAAKLPNAALGRRRSVILILAIALPMLALAIYGQLGHRLDIELRLLQSEIVKEGIDDSRWQRYQDLVTKILEKRPESAEHLVMMATLFRQQGDFAGALPYYQRLEALYPQDADVLAQLAQARYLVDDRRVDATTQDLLDRALAINPQQATALGVMGINAFAAGRYGEALKYWQSLLQVLPPNSGEASVIAEGVVEAKRLAMARGEVQSIALTVALNSDLGSAPAGVLFVVAKSTDGMPMPVAALRIPLSGQEWPIALHLTDSDVIRQGKVLADFPELIVSAHISLAGTAIRQAGDWVSDPIQISNIGELAPIALHINAIHGAK